MDFTFRQIARTSPQSHSGVGTIAVVTTNLILGETWTLARVRGVGHRRALALIDAVPASARVEVVIVDAAIERQAWSWIRLHDESLRSRPNASSRPDVRRASGN